MDKNRICIDVGGTKTRVALISTNQVIMKREDFATDPDNPESTLDRIVRTVKGWDIGKKDVYMCAPGPFNEDNTMILTTSNLPGWNRYPIIQTLREKLGTTVKMINDANAAALGESIIHKQFENILYFTVSTGFGGGFVHGEKLYTGEYNTAFEIKDYIVEKPKKLKYGNLKGLEDFVSGTGIAKLANLNGLNIKDASEVFKLAGDENEIALEILEYVETTISNFLKNLSFIINPGAIILGGSVVLRNSNLFNNIIEKYYDGSDHLLDRTKIFLASEDGSSGLLGLTIA